MSPLLFRFAVCVLIASWVSLGWAAPRRQPTLAEAPPFRPDVPEAEEPAEPVGEADRPADRQADASASPTEELREALRGVHPWGRFDVGAWRQLRVVSEAFDGDGEFAGRTVAERTERLVALDEVSYTLATEAVVSLAGMRRPEAIETQRYSLLTDRPYGAAKLRVERDEPTSVTLGEVAMPCERWRLRQALDGGSQSDTLFISTANASSTAGPLVLRREGQATLGGQSATRRVEAVVRTGAPGLYGEAITSTWHATTEVTHPGGAYATSFSIRSGDVPGGLHSESTTEYDAEGSRLRWEVRQVVAAGRTAAERLSPIESGAEPAVSVEVRPRRFFRLLRRDQRRAGGP